MNLPAMALVNDENKVHPDGGSASNIAIISVVGVEVAFNFPKTIVANNGSLFEEVDNEATSMVWVWFVGVPLSPLPASATGFTDAPEVMIACVACVCVVAPAAVLSFAPLRYLPPKLP